jgi:hypothetical protein
VLDHGQWAVEQEYRGHRHRAAAGPDQINVGSPSMSILTTSRPRERSTRASIALSHR